MGLSWERGYMCSKLDLFATSVQDRPRRRNILVYTLMETIGNACDVP